MTPEIALKKLIDGNSRFQSGLKSIDSISTHLRRVELAKYGQKPFAMILSCADSRVPSELVFDVGLGELFVVRVAGNMIAPSLLASLEFAALNFKPSICLVLGHSQCGAIKATIESCRTGVNAPTDHIQDLLLQLKPAVHRTSAKEATSKCSDQEFETRVTRENVQMSMEQIFDRSQILRDLVESQKMALCGGVYDLHTGKVDFFNTGFINSNAVESDSRNVANIGSGSITALS